MTRTDVYQSVTDRLIEAIEAGTAPWQRPWIGGGPVNVRNGRAYRGINIFLLEMTSAFKGYSDPRWGTYKALGEVGAQVRKGEHATSVILWKPVPKKKASDDEEDSNYMLLRSYSVFNAEQADGVPALPKGFEHDPSERAEEIVRGYVPHGPLIQFGGSSAFYRQDDDVVGCPQMSQFKKIEGYYSTLFHELVHSTGHKSRLDRLQRTGFGSGPYAKEELVAEMGAAMLCGSVGIDNLDQSASYVKGWLRPLQEDPRFAIQAAANAQRAADLILGATFDSDSQPTEKALVAA